MDKQEEFLEALHRLCVAAKRVGRELEKSNMISVGYEQAVGHQNNCRREVVRLFVERGE